MSKSERNRLATMLFAAVVFAVGLLAIAVIEPREAAAGWLIGFLFWSQIPVGSLLLTMIHSLTGGRWGFALRPVLAPATAAVPWLFLAIVPVFLGMPLLYSWATSSSVVKPDVAADYLNQSFFIGRSVIALAVWSALSILMRLSAPRYALLIAGIGLALYGITISVVAIDWFLALEPPFVSSSFGASVGIMQLITAMAWGALLAPEPAADPVAGDIGGLLLAFVLGITYVDFMAILVIWYGDLPHKEFWFVERDHFPWSALAAAAFVLGSVVPIFALFLSRIRNSRAALRPVAISVLLGSMLYIAYLIAPSFGVFSLVPAVLALIVIGLLQSAAAAAASLMVARTEALRHGY